MGDGGMEKRFDGRLNRLTHPLQSFNRFLISYLTSGWIIPVRSRDLLISKARNILKHTVANPFSSLRRSLRSLETM
ncbi:MAG: hypothetical protein QW406_05505 [Ignisphaera sp.]